MAMYSWLLELKVYWGILCMCAGVKEGSMFSLGGERSEMMDESIVEPL